MKKEEVYKLIEYNGIYDDKVKRNLKKIIKKYHPDKNPVDNKIIQVIYEVKKELETGNISYNPIKKDVKKNDFISKSECLENLDRLHKEKRNNDLKLKELYNKLSNFLKEYNNIYTSYCTAQNSFCVVQDRIKKLKNYYLYNVYINSFY